MTEKIDQKIPSQEASNNPPGKAVVTLTVIGLLFVLAAFSILYRAERTDNRQWILKQADVVDPKDPGNDARMVKFTGVPSGTFIDDPDTGKQFVYLTRSRYEYLKSAEPSSKADWQYKDGVTVRAKDIRIGTVTIRLDEAEIIGGGAWTTTITQNRKDDKSAPRIGDLKMYFSGIPADIPLFCAGRLSGGYLGAGDLFIVSSFSEGKTMEELEETWVWRWIRHPICFFLLVIGFTLLGHPAMRTMKLHADLPVIHSLSRIGWPAYIAIIIPASFLLVRFSRVTADLLWVIIALIIATPAVIIILKIRSRRLTS